MFFFKRNAARSQYRQIVRELSSMTDRELNDIGLARGDIDDVARGTYHGRGR